MTANALISTINNQDDAIVSDKSLNWLTHTRDQTILEAGEFSSSEEEDEDYDDEFTESVCGCGKTLEADWSCDGCRVNCSTCNRALVPEEECSRCLPLPRL